MTNEALELELVELEGLIEEIEALLDDPDVADVDLRDEIRALLHPDADDDD